MGQRDAAYLLSGIVEFDDSYFEGPGKGGKRGRGTTKSKVLIAMDTSNYGRPKYLKMQVAPNLKGKTIGDFAKSAILSGSTIISDAFHSYRKPLEKKFLHLYKVYDPDSGELRWLHTMIGNAKAFVQGTYHGLGKKHLQCYLDEFCYRFNRRNFPGEAFARLLAAVMAANPLSLAELKG